jgi:hypothetical protein
MTAIELCLNKEVRSKATFYYYSDGKGEWKYDGQLFTDKEFNEAFPVNVLAVKPDSLKGENSDRTKAWLES